MIPVYLHLQFVNISTLVQKREKSLYLVDGCPHRRLNGLGIEIVAQIRACEVGLTHPLVIINHSLVRVVWEKPELFWEDHPFF